MSTGHTGLLLVTKHKLRMTWRRFADSVRRTPEGKVAVVVMVAGPFLMKNMMVSSALRQAELSDNAAWVILWAAHLSMMAALVLGVASRTARSLIVNRREDPLALYPGARQGLAAYHLWGEVVSPTVLWLFVFFYLFYGGLVSGLGAQPVTGTLLHVIGHTVISLALGAVAYRLTLRGLERRPTLGRPIFVVAATSAIVAFLAMAGSPQFLVELAPHRMGEIRSLLDRVALLYAPLTALAQPLRVGGVLAWSLGVGTAGAIALGAAAPLIRSPSTIVLGEAEGPVRRRFESVFGGLRGAPSARVLHGARMFFLKDAFLPTVRSPRRSFARQATFLGTAAGAPVLAWGLLQEGRLGEVGAEALVLGLVIVLASAAAYLRGLGSLGMEGPALALLRPVVRPSELLGYKTLAVMASVLPGGLLYGAVAGALSVALDMRPGPLAAAGIGGLAAVVGAGFAVSLGFLFPDLERQNVLVPGASRLGRFAFISLATYAGGLAVALRWMTRSGMLPPTLFLPGLIATAGVSMAVTGIVMVLALRRFPHLEH